MKLIDSRRPRRLVAALALLSAPLYAQEHVAFQSGERLVVVDDKGEEIWGAPMPSCEEIHALPNGNMLVLTTAGEIAEVSRGWQRVVWFLDPTEVLKPANARDDTPAGRASTIRPGGDQNILALTASPLRLIEINRMGESEREVKFDVTDVAGTTILDSGDVLVATTSGDVLEFDGTSGDVVSKVSAAEEFPIQRPALLARAANGTTMVASPGGVHIISSEGDRTSKPRSSNAPLGYLAAVGDQFIVGDLKESTNLYAIDAAPGSTLGEKKLSGVAAASALRILSSGEDAALLERAREIHWNAITLDTHKDISPSLASPELPEDPVQARRAILRNDPTVWGTNQVDFPKMQAGGLDVAFYIVYVGQGSLDEEGFARARGQALAKFDAIERMEQRYPDRIEIARSAADVERIVSEGKLVACIGIENGYAMGEDIAAIEEFHSRGARYMSITHNRHSQLGDSNTPADEPVHGGLSDLGRAAIEEMNRVGIMVDISHAAPTTTLQAIAHSKAPVIASHSSVDGVYEHGRNLSDEELLALKENGGVIQCVAFASYVKDLSDRREFIVKTREELGLPAQRRSRAVDDSPETREKMQKLRERMAAYDATYDKSSVKHFADHIDYAVKLIGIDHVAISSDFDGGGGVEGWQNASETFNVTLELVRRGYSAEEIEKLWSGNTLRVWRAVEEVAEELK